MKNIIERLKICWSVLTKQNYVYFGTSKHPLIWNKDGSFSNVDKRQVAEYDYIDNSVCFYTSDGKTNIAKFLWESIRDYADNRYKNM